MKRVFFKIGKVKSSRLSLLAGFFFLLTAAFLPSLFSPSQVMAKTTVVVVDNTIGVVGTAFRTAVALDASGYPVVAYYDATNTALKILHCNDVSCSGGNESITSPDAAGDVGWHLSMALDSSGYPVVSYLDHDNGNLKILHCNDANCSGGDESINVLDFTGAVYLANSTSLALDSLGYPVVSYLNKITDDLKILHCNDANCSGGDESIVTADAVGRTGFGSSLRLDSSGYPVVSYFDASVYGSYDLKILHCNDANCSGGDESITAPDATGSTYLTSLTIDSSGYPVVAYVDRNNYDLKILHCNDANCLGGDESVTIPDSLGMVGLNAKSIALDALGYPVVSYWDVANYDLKLLHCNDVNCAGGNENITIPDGDGTAVGYGSSLVLNASGFPLISYYSTGALKVLHDTNEQPKPPTRKKSPREKKVRVKKNK